MVPSIDISTSRWGFSVDVIELLWYMERGYIWHATNLFFGIPPKVELWYAGQASLLCDPKLIFGMKPKIIFGMQANPNFGLQLKAVFWYTVQNYFWHETQS